MPAAQSQNLIESARRRPPPTDEKIKLEVKNECNSREGAKKGGDASGGGSQCSFINIQTYSQTHSQTRTHSHTFFNPAEKWGVGNDRGEEEQKERLGPGFSLPPLAYLKDIPIR